MSLTIFVEGGNPHDTLSLSECRKGFRVLLEKSGFKGKMPTFIACGGRQRAFKEFEKAMRLGDPHVVLLVDSEDPIADIEKPWEHLAARTGDAMRKPKDATDAQALLMATCMETWIVADPAALAQRYKHDTFHAQALPPLVDLESRHRHDVQDRLAHATRDSRSPYKKGSRSFKALENVDPDRIRDHLPSFARVERILKAKL